MNVPKGRKRIIGKRTRVVENAEEEAEEPEESESIPHYVVIEAWDKLQAYSLAPQVRAEVYAACLHSILTHILFSLSMLPSPYQALKREMTAYPNPSLGERRGTKHTKITAFITHLEYTLDLSSTILSTYDIKTVCIGIGVSMYNLKCVYKIHIPIRAPIHTTHAPTPTPVPVRLDNLKRLCMQKLVEFE
ncbi:hypothetical protein EON65_34790, partial [archaeon]